MSCRTLELRHLKRSNYSLAIVCPRVNSFHASVSTASDCSSNAATLKRIFCTHRSFSVMVILCSMNRSSGPTGHNIGGAFIHNILSATGPCGMGALSFRGHGKGVRLLRKPWLGCGGDWGSGTRATRFCVLESSLYVLCGCVLNMRLLLMIRAQSSSVSLVW